MGSEMCIRDSLLSVHGAGRLYISQYRAAMRSGSAGVYTAIYGQQSVSRGIRAADVVLCVVTADETGGCCVPAV